MWPKLKDICCTIFALCFLVSPVYAGQPPQVTTLEQHHEMTYETFLKERKQENVVVLDAAALEQYFLVVPEDVAAQRQGTMTQKKLDNVLSSLIPGKDTSVILFCYENFFPTRKISASASVAHSLVGNGYKNVYVLQNLWGGKYSQEQVRILEQKEVRPYAKAVPEDVLK